MKDKKTNKQTNMIISIDAEKAFKSFYKISPQSMYRRNI